MVQKFKTLPDAIALAEFGHRNQQDKAGMPYIDHPKRVLATVQAMGAKPYVQSAAALHDITEDTAITPQILLDLGFSEAVVNLVKLLDRGYSRVQYCQENVGWGDYYDKDGFEDRVAAFYYAGIKANPDAVIIKTADIRDNLSPWRLSYLSEPTQVRLREKYAKALEAIGAEL